MPHAKFGQDLLNSVAPIRKKKDTHAHNTTHRGKWWFSTPQNWHPFNQSPKFWHRWLLWRLLQLCQIWYRSVHRELRKFSL